VFVKVVVEPSTPLDEIDEAVRLVAGIDPNVPLVLQPEGSVLSRSARAREAREQLSTLLETAQMRALDRLHDVRVIPQCHKLLKVK
jgi:organic radical activating enzyme